MKSKYRKPLRVLLVLLVLGGAAAIATLLVLTRPDPPKEDAGPRAPKVAVERVTRQPTLPIVHAEGVVRPARQVAVTPRVSGKVVWIADELEPGGVVRRDEPLFRIDRTDFLLALRRSRTEVAAAEADIEVAEGQRAIAKEEWEQFERERWSPDLEPNALTLRKPQLNRAQARLEAAQAAVAQNQLALSRTVVKAPFDALVDAESVDVGSYVSPGSPVAQLVGVEKFWVEVTMAASKLPAIALPGVDAEKGAAVTITFDAGEFEVTRRGRVTRLLGRVAEASRLARLLVTVDDPLGLGDEGGMPLLVGSFVEVAIETREQQSLVELPREALRQQNEVWVVDEQDRLDIRELDVHWRSPDTVLVGEGLSDGDRVVTSALARPVEGMKLRPQTGEDDA